jgi:hypothetical protein
VLVSADSELRLATSLSASPGFRAGRPFTSSTSVSVKGGAKLPEGRTPDEEGISTVVSDSDSFPFLVIIAFGITIHLNGYKKRTVPALSKLDDGGITAIDQQYGHLEFCCIDRAGRRFEGRNVAINRRSGNASAYNVYWFMQSENVPCAYAILPTTNINLMECHLQIKFLQTLMSSLETTRTFFSQNRARPCLAGEGEQSPEHDASLPIQNRCTGQPVPEQGVKNIFCSFLTSWLGTYLVCRICNSCCGSLFPVRRCVDTLPAAGFVNLS